MPRANHYEDPDDDVEDGASPAHIRIRGVLLLVGGGAGAFAAMLASAFLAQQGLFPKHGGIPAMIVIFVPVAAALAGFIELLTGLEVRRVPGKWDDLKGWQRGILGTLIAFSPFLFYSIGVELF